MSQENVPDEDFELEAFIDLFDTAMSSDNPAVKKALQNLLMISTLVNSEQSSSSKKIGPLRRMQETVKNLGQRMSAMEAKQYQTNYNTITDSSNMNSVTYTWSGISPSTGIIAQSVPSSMLNTFTTTQSDDYDN